MELEWAVFPVENMQLGETNSLSGRVLQINPGMLRKELLQDERLLDCQFAVMRPGDNVRAVHVIDVVEPRVKVKSNDYFAGMIGSLSTLGMGQTNILRGATVVVSCPFHGAQEGIIDMTGTAASLSKFGHTCNLVVMPEVKPDVSLPDATKAVIECGLRASVILARTTLDGTPEIVERYRWAEPLPDLPRVAYIYYLYSHGHGRERYLFGKTTRDILPTIVHPNEILDGGIVHSGMTMPSKSVTFNHINNGVLRSLYKRHNTDLSLAGVIMVNHNLTFNDKQRSASLAARLAKYLLKCDGVIITKDGGGQADVDLAECCDSCEQEDLKTVLLVKEEGGEIGAGYPLVVVSRRADAIVTTGNGVESIQVLNEVNHVVGGETFYDGTSAQAQNTVLPYNYIVGAVDFEGDLCITSREY